MMGCKEFFSENQANPQKCKELQKRDKATLNNWETESASDFSPGVVENDEVLYQQIVDPTHLDPHRAALKPTAFQDSANKGLSTHRVAFSSWDDLVAVGKRRAEQFNADNPERPPRSLWGFASFRTSDVRGILAPSQERAYFVYDTANENDRSHADICQGVAGDKHTERSIRASLYDLAKGGLLAVSAEGGEA
jgi:hypothetical protein